MALNPDHAPTSKQRSGPPPARRPYQKPTLQRIEIVPEEMMVAVCVKTPSVCHPGQISPGHSKVKS